MLRIEYERYGTPEVMHLSAFNLPAPKEKEVLVRVRAAGLNPFDWKLRRGDLKIFTGSKLPRAMGSDFAGVVEAVGPNVTCFCVGDDVIGTVSPKASGAFAEKLITVEKLLVKKPPSMSFAQAATLPVAAVTAWQAIVDKASVKSGQHVFLNGALGADGRAAIAIAQDLGANVTGRVGKNALEEARSLGLKTVLNYAKPIPSELQKTFDLVFDCNGSLSLQESAMLMKPGGMVIDIMPNGAKIINFLFRWHQKIIFANTEAKNLQKVVDFAAKDKLSIPIGRTAPLAEAILMITEVEQGQRPKGKAVIVFD